MHRVIVFLFFMLITGSGLYFITPLWLERQRHQAKLDKVNTELLVNERLEANAKGMIADLGRDVTDPHLKAVDKSRTDSLRTRIAREKFGFCRDGERVYIFDDEDAYRKTLKE
ncbi:MAG: hypothetical protein RL095_3605 [Verrucomicrobiota bacterium]